MIAVDAVVPTPAQAQAFSALHASAFSASARGWSAAEILDLAKAPGVLLLAEHGSPPRGFALFRQILDEAELLTLCVAPDHWNKGVASALMASGLDFLRANECQSVFLEVAETNVMARRLYARYGFKAVARREDYYAADGHGAAIVLALAL
jgi:ribosomal-protein-alanine N-acetyltransferase